MGIKRCPKCGNAKLLARKIIGVQVESLENGEFKINAEGSKYQLEIIGCAKCKANFDDSQLVEMVQCKKCGKLTAPENLDANGKCDVCHALEERPDLANMSKEDLIRMMLKLEKTTATTSAPKTPTSVSVEEPSVSSTAQEKMKAAQEAISNASNDFSKEIIKETEEELKETQAKVDEMQNAMNPPVEPDTTEQEVEKPKRGRKPKKKTEVTEENQTDTEEVSEEEVQQSANEISESQEAPFPEQDSEMKQMFDDTTPQEEQTPMPQQQTGMFEMFESEQSF